MYRRGYLPVITVKTNEILEFGEKKISNVFLKYILEITSPSFSPFTFRISKY